jgi:hypothetical protein
MAFPSGANLTTTNLDSSADDPSLARADLLDLMNKVQDIIDSENSADGVVVLDSSGQLDSTILPTNWQPESLTISALNTGIVQINDQVGLGPMTKAELAGYAAVAYAGLGWITICQDATSSPTAMSGVSLTNPLRITTSTPHQLQPADQITVASVGGTTELNGNTYYVSVVDYKTIDLYTDSGLSTAVDGTTGFSAYTSGGTVTGPSGPGLVVADGTDYLYLSFRNFGKIAI